MVGTLMYTFNDWSKTSWDKIDVEFLMEESKKLTKDIKTLNKAVRNYEVFRLLEEALKGMLTSLPLVQVRGGSRSRSRYRRSAQVESQIAAAGGGTGDLLVMTPTPCSPP